MASVRAVEQPYKPRPGCCVQSGLAVCPYTKEHRRAHGRPAWGPSKIPAQAAPAARRGRGSASGGLAPGPRAPRARPRAAAARQPRQRVPDTCALRLRPLRTAPARRARPRRQTGSPRRRYLGVLHQNLRSALDAVPRRRRRCNEAASKPLNRWPPDIARALLDRIVCVCVRSPACDGGVRRRRARTAPHF